MKEIEKVEMAYMIKVKSIAHYEYKIFFCKHHGYHKENPKLICKQWSQENPMSEIKGNQQIAKQVQINKEIIQLI